MSLQLEKAESLNNDGTWQLSGNSSRPLEWWLYSFSQTFDENSLLSTDYRLTFKDKNQKFFKWDEITKTWCERTASEYFKSTGPNTKPISLNEVMAGQTFKHFGNIYRITHGQILKWYGNCWRISNDTITMPVSKANDPEQKQIVCADIKKHLLNGKTIEIQSELFKLVDGVILKSSKDVINWVPVTCQLSYAILEIKYYKVIDE